MSTTQVQSTTAPMTLGAATSPAVKPADGKQQVDYLKLIVAQMRNLNPMDPNSGGDSLPTMMQAESLNQLTMLNTALKDLQTMTQTTYASSLLGHEVTGIDDANNTVSGTVSSLKMDIGGPVLELANGKKLRLLDVTQVGGA